MMLSPELLMSGDELAEKSEGEIQASRLEIMDQFIKFVSEWIESVEERLSVIAEILNEHDMITLPDTGEEETSTE